MVVDALAAILDKAKAAGHIRGITPHLVGGSGISLLQYADDTIIMVEGSETDISNLKFLLLCFQQMSGLKINFDKSDVMVMGYSPEECLSIANRLNCRLGSFPTTYLGTAISDSRLTVADLRRLWPSYIRALSPGRAGGFRRRPGRSLSTPPSPASSCSS